MARINLIDGNNQFFLKMPKATSMDHLVESCLTLHHGYDIVYWIFDGLDSRKPRRDIYSEYKNTKSRQKNSEDRTKYEVLKVFKQEKLPMHGGCIIIEIPFVEADDIIRKLAHHHVAQGDQITISSNDVDIAELTALPGVIQPQARLPKCCPKPELISIYKTLVGDSGDNIKGLKGFGEKAWENLSESDLTTITHKITSRSDTFDVELDDAKLTVKVRENWEEIKMWYSVVGYIDFDDELLKKHLKVFPKTSYKPPVQPLTMNGA